VPERSLTECSTLRNRRKSGQRVDGLRIPLCRVCPLDLRAWLLRPKNKIFVLKLAWRSVRQDGKSKQGGAINQSCRNASQNGHPTPRVTSKTTITILKVTFSRWQASST